MKAKIGGEQYILEKALDLLIMANSDEYKNKDHIYKQHNMIIQILSK